MWHDGTSTVFRNYLHAGGNILFQGEDTSGVNHALLYMFCDNAAPYVSIYGDGNEKLKIEGSVSTFFNTVDIPDYIRHSGDTNCYFGFPANDQFTVYVGGSQEIHVNTTGVRLGDTGNGYFQPVSGNYGSIQIDGGAHSSWEGYSIGGRIVFMHDNSTAMGLYNDVNNEWMFYGITNAATYMYYNGANKFQTTSGGAQVNGNLVVTGTISGGGSLSAWATMDGSGTVTIRADDGFTSIVDVNVGRYYANISTQPNIYYATTCGSNTHDGTAWKAHAHPILYTDAGTARAPTTTRFYWHIIDYAASAYRDVDYMMMHVAS